jgi:hypothetical protein
VAWEVQILFSNSLMVSTSACWLSAMFLASVIASGSLAEAISAWAILIAPWWCLIIRSRRSRWPSAPLALPSSASAPRSSCRRCCLMGAFRHLDATPCF